MNKLRLLRIDKKLSCEELAKILNVHKVTISSWELGKREPDISSIIKLANFFNVSIDYLLDNDFQHFGQIKYLESYGEYAERLLQDAIDRLIREEKQIALNVLLSIFGKELHARGFKNGNIERQKA